MLSFEVRNLFDKDFNFQDDSFREFSRGLGDENLQSTASPFVPERTFLARITLNF